MKTKIFLSAIFACVLSANITAYAGSSGRSLTEEIDEITARKIAEGQERIDALVESCDLFDISDYLKASGNDRLAAAICLVSSIDNRYFADYEMPFERFSWCPGFRKLDDSRSQAFFAILQTCRQALVMDGFDQADFRLGHLWLACTYCQIATKHDSFCDEAIEYFNDVVKYVNLLPVSSEYNDCIAYVKLNEIYMMFHGLDYPKLALNELDKHETLFFNDGVELTTARDYYEYKRELYSRLGDVANANFCAETIAYFDSLISDGYTDVSVFDPYDGDAEEAEAFIFSM